MTTTVTERATGTTGATGPSGVASSEPSRSEAVAVVDRFYRLIDAYRYDEAWTLVPPEVQAESGGYSNWRAGYRANVRSVPRNLIVDSISANRAAIALDLEAVDIDACTGEKVEQLFSGSWTLKTVGRNWKPIAATFDKVSGGTPTLSSSECPSPGGSSAGGAPSGCDPNYDPCVPTYPPDVDCPDVDGPVAVTGSDPHGLDADSDGEACEV